MIDCRRRHGARVVSGAALTTSRPRNIITCSRKQKELCSTAHLISSRLLHCRICAMRPCCTPHARCTDKRPESVEPQPRCPLQFQVPDATGNHSHAMTPQTIEMVCLVAVVLVGRTWSCPRQSRPHACARRLQRLHTFNQACNNCS